jgi:hypothetical protein
LAKESGKHIQPLFIGIFLSQLNAQHVVHRFHPCFPLKRYVQDAPTTESKATQTSPTRPEAFRTRWTAHNLRFHHTGVKRLHHPVVGDLTLNYQTMQL